MFGKNSREEITRNEGQQMENDNIQRIYKILENIMSFTGAENLDELELVVENAGKTKNADDDAISNSIYEAICYVRDNYSIFEAKEMEKNQDFLAAISAGFEPEKAYMMAKGPQLIAQAYEEGEQQGKNIAHTKEDRIDEVGMNAGGGYKAEIDPAQMTMSDLKKIKERLRKGENVRL
ncbi:MAG: hypothetical protein IJC89_05180 [Clostridia bacterium]|nr:hypothetical protein [Clostridia bacterium]